jgi:thiol-disulfide isomerase/thioredoxin
MVTALTRQRDTTAGKLAARFAMSGLLALVGSLFIAAHASAQDIGLPVGATPDAAVVEDLDGNAVDLGRIVGTKPALLEFWATWCPLCEELEPQMRTIAQRYGTDIEVLVIAVGVNQNPRSIRRHLQRHEVPGRILFDARGAATRAYRAPTTSYVVLLDRNGKVAYTGQGSDQDLLKAVQQVLRR